jgi:hypothetical protein
LGEAPYKNRGASWFNFEGGKLIWKIKAKYYKNKIYSSLSKELDIYPLLEELKPL